MASREWLLTKIVGTALGLVTLVSICIGGANVLFEVKNDVRRVETDVIEHKQDDVRRWDKVTVEVEKNREAIHVMEVQNARVETNQKEIIRKLDDMADLIKEIGK